MSDSLVLERNGRAYFTARAEVVSDPSQLPRELASIMEGKKLNPELVWISGRYVQGEKLNRNGQFWSTDDLKAGEYSVQHTPLNVLHQWDKPVGTFVETKMVHREAADTTTELLPEIQALSVLWGNIFPQIADRVKEAHAEGKLWYSMECIGEAKQCLTCDKTFEWSAAEYCEHLEGSKTAPRRFINPMFLGGALIYPPTEPGWVDADIEELAKATREFADRNPQIPENLTDRQRESLLHLNMLSGTNS